MIEFIFFEFLHTNQMLSKSELNNSKTTSIFDGLSCDFEFLLNLYAVFGINFIAFLYSDSFFSFKIVGLNV
jgi:hypothetical protein